MKVSKIMTKAAGSCGPSDRLPAAAGVMWKHDCGMVPVVDGNEVVGVITDRDIAIAVASRGVPAGDISVGEVATRKPVTCRPDDKVETALSKMRKQRVRRLPVVDGEGGLEGVISIADVLHASKNKKSLRKEVLKTIRSVSEPCPIVLSEMH